ncbi:hypothetical protein GJ744_000649 [Endocarpon pusillum]|uniref:Uncharacterized protein n=1 Tax=Endocarpon pusillum TaxID=364733 RepID=A0A8H7E004_9EURO|nr:hypothetical protein GJ744_000649 [Endocarpon pusillum]
MLLLLLAYASDYTRLRFLLRRPAMLLHFHRASSSTPPSTSRISCVWPTWGAS